MKKKKIIVSVIIIALFVIVPITILANSKKKVIERVALGSQVIEVEEGKTDEDMLKEKFEGDKIYREKSEEKPLDIDTVNGIIPQVIDIPQKNTLDTNQDLAFIKDTGKDIKQTEKELEEIARKYDKIESFNKIKDNIEKKEQTGEFTDEHKKMCELFISIYKNENLIENEQSLLRYYFEITRFSDIDNELLGELNNILK